MAKTSRPSSPRKAKTRTTGSARPVRAKTPAKPKKKLAKKTIRKAAKPATGTARKKTAKKPFENQNQTQVTKASVSQFIASVENEQKRKDCRELLKVMKQITNTQPKMWGPSIVGFGRYRYRYPTGREGEWFLAGFSPRAQNLTIYIMSGFSKHPNLMKKLGTFKTGKSCLYVKRLDDVDRDVLKELIKVSAKSVAERSV